MPDAILEVSDFLKTGKYFLFSKKKESLLQQGCSSNSTVFFLVLEKFFKRFFLISAISLK